MVLCNGSNLTVIFRTYPKGKLSYVEGNRLKGYFGSRIDSLFGKISDQRCRIIGVQEIGGRLSNSTDEYGGALGALQRKEADLCLTLTTQYFKKDFFHHTKAVHNQDLVIAHKIDHSFDQAADHAVFISEGVKATFLIVSILFFLMLIRLKLHLIDGQRIRIRSKRLIENYFNFRSEFKKPACLYGLMLIFNRIFLTLLKTIYANSIKTAKVTIKTDNLINSFEQLLHKTSLVVCWFRGFMIKFLAEEAAGNTQLHQIYIKRVFDEPQLDPVDGKAIMTHNRQVNNFLTRFVTYDPEVDYFQSKSLWEQIMVHYYRVGLNRLQVEKINKFAISSMEFGLTISYIEHFKTIVQHTQPYHYNVYHDELEYVKDKTTFTSLDYSFFDFLFKFVLIIQFFTFLLWFIEFNYRYLKRQIQTSPTLSPNQTDG